MTARELLQAMLPYGIFVGWSSEDVTSQLLMMLRQRYTVKTWPHERN